MLNCAIIMGRLVADPELRSTQSGKNVTSFRVAVDRSFQKQGEERQADFIDVVAWERSAEFVTRFFKKGSMIAVQGRIQTRTYDDKNGNKRTAVEIVAEQVNFTGSKAESGSGNGGGGYEPARTQPAPAFASASSADFEEIAVDDDMDGLPF